MKEYWKNMPSGFKENLILSERQSGIGKTEMKNQHNPFSLFESVSSNTVKKANNEFYSCYQRFVKEWNRIRVKYQNVGAGDSASGDSMFLWIKEQLANDL